MLNHLRRQKENLLSSTFNGHLKELYKSLKSLGTAQLNFHESDRWSPQECLYHIAFSEGALRGALDGALNAPADPSSRAELQATDDQIKAMITNRTTKVKQLLHLNLKIQDTNLTMRL